MSSQPSIETLREWVARDQEAFRLQNEWLTELQDTPAEKLNRSYRNVLQQWDRSVVKECNRHLSAMEDIAEPNVEERKLMQELNKLVNLGDHMIDRAIAVQAELEAKLGKVDMSDAPAPMGKGRREVEEDVKAAPKHTTAAPATPGQAPAAVPQPTSAPTPPPTAPTGASAEKQEDSDVVNPADLYKLLGVPSDAQLAVVKKAIKKQTILRHPDKNPDNPDASSKFADFSAACKVFESEESRAQFDETGQVDQIPDLSSRVRSLTMN